MKRQDWLAVWIAALAIHACAALAAEGADSLRVAAAISLKEPLESIAKSFESEHRTKVEFVLGASGQLQTQIQNGAEIDVFLSAAIEPVDALEKAKLTLPETCRAFAGNRLVLVAPADAKRKALRFEELGDATVSRLAIGEPKTVPAGQYAMQVLDHLKLTDDLKDRLLYGANVRQVLDYVERGEVTAGIVYATDVSAGGSRVAVMATADRKWHNPIQYVAVGVKATKQPDLARKFIEHLDAEPSRKCLLDRGFLPPEAPTSFPASQPAAAKPGNAPPPARRSDGRP